MGIQYRLVSFSIAPSDKNIMQHVHNMKSVDHEGRLDPKAESLMGIFICNTTKVL